MNNVNVHAKLSFWRPRPNYLQQFRPHKTAAAPQVRELPSSQFAHQSHRGSMVTSRIDRATIETARADLSPCLSPRTKLTSLIYQRQSHSQRALPELPASKPRRCINVEQFVFAQLSRISDGRREGGRERARAFFKRIFRSRKGKTRARGLRQGQEPR